MKVPRFRTFLSLCAILAFPWCLMFGGANNEAAVLRSSGAVSLNGTGAPATTALFSGDQVQTAKGGVVTISSPGSSVFVPSDSQVVLKGNVLNVTTGTARISTTKGMAVQAESSLISPSGGKANFEVSRYGNDVLVHATNGALTVSTAGKTFAVAEGSTQTINAATGNLVKASAVQGGSLLRPEAPFGSDGPVNGKYNLCEEAKFCHRGSDVSGIHPCRCRKL